MASSRHLSSAQFSSPKMNPVTRGTAPLKTSLPVHTTDLAVRKTETFMPEAGISRRMSGNGGID